VLDDIQESANIDLVENEKSAKKVELLPRAPLAFLPHLDKPNEYF